MIHIIYIYIYKGCSDQDFWGRSQKAVSADTITDTIFLSRIIIYSDDPIKICRHLLRAWISFSKCIPFLGDSCENLLIWGVDGGHFFKYIFISPKGLIMHCIFVLTIVQLLHNSLHTHKPDLMSGVWGGLLHRVHRVRCWSTGCAVNNPSLLVEVSLMFCVNWKHVASKVVLLKYLFKHIQIFSQPFKLNHLSKQFDIEQYCKFPASIAAWKHLMLIIIIFFWLMYAAAAVTVS